MWLSVPLLLTTFFAATTTAQSFPSSTFIYNGDDNGNYTIAVNVPSTNANNDLYFRVIAPAALSWYGFGFGTQMAGSLVFVMYASADGKNVTVSPRLATGHTEPTVTNDVQVTVLEGSGIINDAEGAEMVVNARCTNCRSWATGKIDVTSTKQPMIYAVGGPEEPITSDSENVNIQQHVGYGKFTLDLVQATGAGGIPSNTNSQTGVDHLDDSDEAGPGSALHALFMCGTFIVLFPAGYLFFRLFERMWIHIAFQSFGLFIFLLGTSSGIGLSIRQDKNPHLNSAHQGIGLVVVLGVLTQWTLGMVHHCIWKRQQKPTIFVKIHRFVGPAVIAIGLINGAIGFNFAGNNMAIIGYIIIVLLMVIFVTLMLFLKRRRTNTKNAMNTPAAQNFRHGLEPQFQPMDPTDAVPLQRVPYNREYSTGPPPPQYGETAPAYGSQPQNGNVV